MSSAEEGTALISNGMALKVALLLLEQKTPNVHCWKGAKPTTTIKFYWARTPRYEHGTYRGG